MSHTEGDREYERCYLSFESRHSPYSGFTYVQKDGSKFHVLYGYNCETKKQVKLFFDSFEECMKKWKELPSPAGYREINP